mmetsp:Transcript_102309/g.328069  ORF Transcript_102309/g.328069 Transcript_102309/m.328069 type:complete len:2519 (-) Transcript_102309:168-7724(-)
MAEFGEATMDLRPLGGESALLSSPGSKLPPSKQMWASPSTDKRTSKSAGPKQSPGSAGGGRMSVSAGPAGRQLPGQRTTKRFPVTPRDLLSRKRVPIWLGASGQREPPAIRVPNVRFSLPDDALEREGEAVQAAEQQEREAESLEVAKRYVLAAEYYEQALAVRRKLAGDDHSHTVLAFERACELVNTWGMRCLAAGQTVAALELLKKAETLTEAESAAPNFTRRAELRGRTFGNLCCYFRSRGKHNAALQFAEKALRLERQCAKEGEDPSRTRLNFAALLSAMGRHPEAVQQNEMAAAALREAERSLSTVNEGPMSARLPSVAAGAAPAAADDITVSLVVAYHNLWVEHAKLSQWSASSEYLLRAVNTARQRLGESHPLTLKMMRSLEASTENDVNEGSPRMQARSASPPSRVNADTPFGGSNATTATPTAMMRLPSVPGSSPLGGSYPPSPSPLYDARHAPTMSTLPARPHSTLAVRTCSGGGGGFGAAPARPHSTAAVRGLELSPDHGEAQTRSPPDSSRWGIGSFDATEQEMAARVARMSSPDSTVDDPRAARALRNGARTASPRLQMLALPGAPSAGRGKRGFRHARTDGGDAMHLPPRPATVADYTAQARSEEDEDVVVARRSSSMQCGAFGCGGCLDERGRCRDCGERCPSSQLGGAALAAAGSRTVVPTPPVGSWNVADALRMAAADCGHEKFASDRIQAHRRELYTQEIVAVETAEVARQQQKIQQLSHRRAVGEGAEPRLRSMTPAAGGPYDNRRRDSYMIVHNARRTYVENRAALKIQKVWRGYSTRFQVQHEIARTAHATATKMQSLYRRYTTLKQAARRKQAAVTIQTKWRQMHEFSNWRELLQNQKFVTRLLLGFIARQRVGNYLRSAIVFQRLIRGFLTRLYVRRREASRIKLQKTARGTVFRRGMLRRNEAARRIGADWRGWADRRNFMLRRTAARKIQSRYRHVLAKRNVRRRQIASAKIGAAWLGHRSWQRKILTSQICVVQARIRGVLTRRKLAREPPAARSIQLFWLSYRKRLRFKTRVAISVVLQKHARRHKVIRRLALVSQTVTSCQRIFRGFHARRCIAEKDEVALRVQAVWYKAIAKWQVKEMQQGAFIIQKFARSLLARWLKFRELAAATRIHAFWTSYKVRHGLRRRLQAASVVQRCYRGHGPRRVLQRRRAAALTIQRLWRRHLSRKSDLNRHQAARRLQKAWRRRFHLRRWRRTFRGGMVLLQNTWRSHLLRRRQQQKKHLALRLQAWYRGRCRRRATDKQNGAALDIQCSWRKMRAERRLKSGSEAATKIQNALKRMHDRRLVRQQIAAASRIGRVMRGILCRLRQKRRPAAKTMGTWLKGRVYRLRYLQQRAAVTRLQTFWRFVVKRRTFKSLRRGGAKVLGSMLKWTWNNTRRREVKAAVSIQTFWRRKATWILRKRTHAAATYIQRIARRMLVLIRLRMKQWLAVKLQALSRRKGPQRHLACAHQSHRQISRLTRCRYAREVRVRKHRGASHIGAAAKMHLALLKLSKEIAAAHIIQKRVRFFLARRRVREMAHVAPVGMQKLMRQIRAVAVIEKYRYLKIREKQRCEAIREARRERAREQAALRIQSFVRFVQICRWYNRKVLPAIPIIQGLCRIYKAKRLTRTVAEAGNRIRSFIRSRRISRMERRHEAAATIHVAYRKFLQRRYDHLNSFKVKTAACIRIQSACRRFCKVKWYQKNRKAATKIQAGARGFLVRHAARKRLRAVVKIQACIFRALHARRLVANRRTCGLRLKAFARKFIAGSRARRRRKAVLPLQACLRSLVYKHRRLARRHEAATKIQSWIRKRRHRCGGTVEVLHLRRHAAVSMQALARGFLVRNRLRFLNRMAHRIQQKFRYRKMLKAMQRYNAAASRIQRMVRGIRHRKVLRTQLRILGTVPSLARGWLWRKRQAAHLNKAASKIQSVYRGGLHREVLVQMMMCAIQLQAWWRGYMAKARFKKIRRLKRVLLMLVYRRRYVLLRRGFFTLRAGIRRAIHRQMPDYRRQRITKASTDMQRAQRGSACRLKLRRKARAASKIQALVRGVLARKYTQRKLEALKKIQSRVAGCYARSVYAKRMRKIVLLQTWMRKRVTRLHREGDLEAVVEILRLTRGIRERREMAKRDAASSTIGRMVRGNYVYRAYQEVLKATRKIQRALHTWQLNLKFWLRLAKATAIQAAWRRHASRKVFKEQRAAGDTLVRAAWMWRHMQLRRARRRAALRISSCWRGYCVRQNRATLQNSSQKIRTWWRSLKILSETAELVGDLMIIKRKVREDYHKIFIVKLQRKFREWSALRKGFRRTRWAVVKLQSHFRRRQASLEVERLRCVVGPNLRRLPSQLVALMLDADRRLTRYRAFRPGEKMSKHSTRIVRLKVLTKPLIWDIEDKIRPLQAFVKHRHDRRAVLRIQGLARGFLARHRLRHRAEAAVQIQAVARGWAQRCLRSRLASLIFVQAWTRGMLERRLWRPQQQLPDAEEAEDEDGGVAAAGDGVVVAEDAEPKEGVELKEEL